MTEDAKRPRPDRERLLLCGANWLGDSIMSMPAVQALKEQDRERPITLLVKENLAPLWSLHRDVDAVIQLRTGPLGLARAIRAVRGERFDRACVFSHSVRAALVPFVARVPVRTGTRGRHRSWLLTRIVNPAAAPDRAHVSFEYMEVAGVEDSDRSRPRLELPYRVVEDCRVRMPEPGDHLVGIIPGAARGRSKRWPVESFAQLAGRLVRESRCRIALLGSPAERPLCAEVAAACGSAAIDLSGKTTLPELAAFLSICRVVIANDSGGMHLAAAAGARVVGLFGATDPAATGPLGEGHVVLQAEGVRGERAIGRTSRAGETSLARIDVGRVFEAANEILSR